jgi:NADH-quinone oxidoreductase subunit E
VNVQTIENIVSKHSNEQGSLIAILSDIQATYSHLPQEALRLVADMTGKSLVDIYGVATFYKYFTLQPRGKHLCSVCVGTACHVRGSETIADAFESQLGVSAGETTKDREFTLEKVACLGACALGPIVVTDGHYFSNVKTNAVKQILTKSQEGWDKVEVKTDERVFPVDVSCPRCNHSLMDPIRLLDGHPSIRVTTSFERKHGWVRLSRLYGSYTVESEPEIPIDMVVDFFCPHCHAELVSAAGCADCNAPMVPMIVRQGGVVQICSRRGCHGHILDLDGVNF